MITAVSPGSDWCSGAGPASGVSNASNGRPNPGWGTPGVVSTTMSVIPASAAPLAASSATPAQVTSSRAPQSRRM